MGAKKARGSGGGAGRARQQQRHHPAQYLNFAKAAPPVIHVALLAVVAALWLGPASQWTTVHVPTPPDWTASYDCGPQHTRHFSEFPAQGLHVLQLAEPDSACSQHGVSSGAIGAALLVEGLT